MALNTVIACPSDKTRTLVVGENIPAGTAVHVGAYTGVCLTGNGSQKRTDAYQTKDGKESISISYPSNPYVKNDNEGTVALAGVFLLPVKGLTADNAKQGALVNIGEDNELTMAAGTAFGCIYTVPSDYATSGKVAVEVNGGK